MTQRSRITCGGGYTTGTTPQRTLRERSTPSLTAHSESDVATRALLAGYRHIDTAAAYRNEAGVGQAIHAAGLERGEVFITTKCFNDDHGHEQAKRACRASLDRLESEYVDLMTIRFRQVGCLQSSDGPARLPAQHRGLSRALSRRRGVLGLSGGLALA